MDLVYPIRGGYRVGPDPLQWSLRTMAQHTRVGRVWIAGEEPPRWLDRSRIQFLEVPYSDHKREHTGRILEAILEALECSEFLWMNDDFFLLEDRDDWPVWAEPGTLREKIEALPFRPSQDHSLQRYGYAAGLRRELELLEEWGFPDPPSLDTHMPIPFNRLLMAEIYHRGRREAPDLPAGFFRSLYYASGMPIERIQDPKIYHYEEPIPRGAGLISTSPIAWTIGRAGRFIRNKYLRPSPWELVNERALV